MTHESPSTAFLASVVSALHATHLMGTGAAQRPVVRRALLPDAERLVQTSLLSSWTSGGRSVALVADHTIERVEGSALDRAMDSRPRTRVLEGLQSDRGSWAAFASAHLARISRRRVSISLYESDIGDASSGWHHDQFDGVVVQVRGSKTWQFDSGRVTTLPGDVMAIPFGVGHAVETPFHSSHLLVAYLPEDLLVPAG